MEELDGESNKDIHGIKGDENESNSKAKKCPNCGLEHPLQPRKKCPAYGSMCLSESSERKPLGSCLPLQKPRRNTRQKMQAKEQRNPWVASSLQE